MPLVKLKQMGEPRVIVGTSSKHLALIPRCAADTVHWGTWSNQRQMAKDEELIKQIAALFIEFAKEKGCIQHEQ